MGVVFTFAGQGAQRPGMLADLPDSDTVRQTLAEADDTLDLPMAGLDEARRLADTRHVQIALTVLGVASARHLIADGAVVDAVMGLSIGAWPAAVIAGALAFDDALRLVAERGRLMSCAYPKDYGMAAVIGLGEAHVRSLVDEVHSDRTPVYVGNVNGDEQIVVAGHLTALTRIAELAERAGAVRTQRLDVAVPSHCALLEAPAAELDRAAAGVAFEPPELAYFSANARRRLWHKEAVRDDLIFNMARTVYWAASARIVHESGFKLAVEMPPGRVLTRLHPREDEVGEAVAVVDAGWHNAAALTRRAAAARR
ncbi:acyltransferase domain-containing protein [Salinisphaera sp. T31B1]|uniref:ACP S-malonyltransferase n=1 Tax=Salinisphaera sp. T31B1 TaxID=727963 RepID=UPI00333ED5FD